MLEARRGGERAFPRCVVFFFQQGKDRVRAFTRVNLRICLLEFQEAIPEIDVLELRPKQDPVDALVLRPIIGFHRAHLFQQCADALCALCDFCWRIIGQPIVPGVKANVAAANGIIFIAPCVIIVSHFV